MVLKPNIVFLKMNLQFIFKLVLKCNIISYIPTRVQLEIIVKLFHTKNGYERRQY